MTINWEAHTKCAYGSVPELALGISEGREACTVHTFLSIQSAGCGERLLGCR